MTRRSYYEGRLELLDKYAKILTPEAMDKPLEALRDLAGLTEYEMSVITAALKNEKSILDRQIEQLETDKE